MPTSSRIEVAFNSEMLSNLFYSMSDQDILIGGQALCYWCNCFNLSDSDPVMTKDADILAPFDSVATIASHLNGRAVYPPRKGFGTALYGQIEIDMPKNTYLNIDVLRVVNGVDTNDIIKRAILINNQYLIMNPVDLLMSKISNFSKIPEKQNDDGKRQALLAVEVIKAFTQYLVEKQLIDQAISVASANSRPWLSLFCPSTTCCHYIFDANEAGCALEFPIRDGPF